MTAMMEPKKILLCLALPDNPYQDNFELEEYGRYAFDKARWMAKNVGASLHILVVIEGTDDTTDEVESKRHEMSRHAVDRLSQELEKEGIEVESTIDEGIAWYEILKHSKWTNSDWIMLSSTRKGVASDGSVLGSTARKVVRQSKRPVWVVQESPAKPIKNIAVPVDLTDISGKLVGAGLRLGELLDANVKLVHSVDYSGELVCFRYPDVQKRLTAYRQKVQDTAREKMMNLAGGDFNPDNIVLSKNNITHVLPEMVSNGETDMVVMGSVSRTGIPGFVIGNRAEKLLNRLECSLLVMKPEGWESPIKIDEKP